MRTTFCYITVYLPMVFLVNRLGCPWWTYLYVCVFLRNQAKPIIGGLLWSQLDEETQGKNRTGNSISKHCKCVDNRTRRDAPLTGEKERFHLFLTPGDTWFILASKRCPWLIMTTYISKLHGALRSLTFNASMAWCSHEVWCRLSFL